ncbi:MAG: AAA family ATPase, partial [Candidatus Cybelea sp.]
VDIAREGASFFLKEQPVSSLVETMLYRLSLDYFLNDKGRLPSIALIEWVIAQLSESDFRFTDIKRVGPVSFEITVIAEGLSDNPMPLQRASQGTLSTVALFGLIERFLRELKKDTPPVVDVTNRSGIVIIDELDAHLHPSWQRKIADLLLRAFPNVQFIASAHSPLIVGGRLKDQVAVLRKTKDQRFVVCPRAESFVGQRVSTIIKDVFETDPVDTATRSYIAQQPMQNQFQREFERLSAIPNPSNKEQEDLIKTMSSLDGIERAEGQMEEEMREQDLATLCTTLKDENDELRAELAALRAKSSE